MYLAITVRTIENKWHPSKILALKGTTVDPKYISHGSHLNYLKFNGCDPNDFFDPNTRTVYLKITPEERARGLKE
jgi:hypothetical protein